MSFSKPIVSNNPLSSNIPSANVNLKTNPDGTEEVVKKFDK